jgi:peptidoglycan hydrolase-like protein with peptidoglycan-binding domain
VKTRLKQLGALVFTASVVFAAPATMAGATTRNGLRPTRMHGSLSSSRVALHVSATEVPINQGIQITVVVFPRTAGRVVTLQRHRTRLWRNVQVKTTKANGKAIFQLASRSPEAISIRALVDASPISVAETSRIATLEFVPPPPVYAGINLAPGDRGAAVTALQERLGQLGYWVGTSDGYFGDATEQAVWALQKSAGLPRSGVVYPTTVAALLAGTLPTPRSTSGYVMEINLKTDLVMFVRNGKVEYVLNTSTGGGYTYTDKNGSFTATTPTGRFEIFAAVNKLVVDSLGSLWRPRYFAPGGYAIHGDSYVPPYPVSHGCARISNEAIDWIWANNIAPVGTPVWVYQ